MSGSATGARDRRVSLAIDEVCPVARLLVRISYAAVAFVAGTLVVATCCGLFLILIHSSSHDFGSFGRALIFAGGGVAAIVAFRVSGPHLQARPPAPPPTPARTAARRLVLVVAVVPEFATYHYGDWARYVAMVAVVLVAIPFAVAGRPVFGDVARPAGILLVVIGVAYFGAYGLGLFPVASGILVLAAGAIRSAPRAPSTAHAARTQVVGQFEVPGNRAAD